MSFKQWLESTEGLEYLLGPKGQLPQIGPEEGVAIQDGIARYVSPHGSYRYVFYQHGAAVSALQLVTMDQKTASIANVYTVPNLRGQGLATQLLQAAKKDFPTISHSPHLSDDGAAWKKKVER